MSSRDDGSATLWALSLAMVVWVSTAALLVVAVAVTARHRAATAADLAALAGAAAVARIEVAADRNPAARVPTACATARAVAVANAAVLGSCTIVGQVVDVVATVRTPALGYLGLGSVAARARAGPG